MNNEKAEHGFIGFKMPIELFNQLMKPDVINKFAELGITIVDSYGTNAVVKDKNVVDNDYFKAKYVRAPETNSEKIERMINDIKNKPKYAVNNYAVDSYYYEEAHAARKKSYEEAHVAHKKSIENNNNSPYMSKEDKNKLIIELIEDIKKEIGIYKDDNSYAKQKQELENDPRWKYPITLPKRDGYKENDSHNKNGKILVSIQEQAKKLLTEKSNNNFNNSLQIDHYEYPAPAFKDFKDLEDKYPFVNFKPYPYEAGFVGGHALPEENPKELKDLKDLPEEGLKYNIGYISRETQQELDNIFDEVWQTVKPERPATHKQINYLKKLGYNGLVPKSQSEASKLINEYKNKPKNEIGNYGVAFNNLPVTYKQQEYLKKLGYSGSFENMTLKAASTLIDELIAKSM